MSQVQQNNEEEAGDDSKENEDKLLQTMLQLLNSDKEESDRYGFESINIFFTLI